MKPKIIVFNKVIWLLLISGLLIVLIWITSLVLNSPQAARAKDFTLPLIRQEGQFTLSEQRGKVVVLNFWGSWCEPCREEAAFLQAMYEDYQSQGVVFLGIAVDDTRPDAQTHIDEFGITYPNVIDEKDEVRGLYHLYGVPVTMILNKDGEVLQLFFSKPPEAVLRRILDDALRS